MLGPPALAWLPFRRMGPGRFKERVNKLAPTARVLLREPVAPYRMDVLLAERALTQHG